MTSAGASARPITGGLSIGAVLARLKGEFPDLTISKIRFLEAEELVTPERTGAGYRQFSAADIARLRYILTAQRDHYLPLKVIREQLDAIDRGADPSAHPAAHGDAQPAAALPRPFAVALAASDFELTQQGETRLTRTELCQEAGLTPEQLDQAESFGLVEVGPRGFYDEDAVLAARTVAELLDLGLESRHLRTLRTTAERESAMVVQLVAATARQRDPLARQRAGADAVSHAATLLRLHALLVKAALARELGT